MISIPLTLSLASKRVLVPPVGKLYKITSPVELVNINLLPETNKQVFCSYNIKYNRGIFLTLVLCTGVIVGYFIKKLPH